MKTYQKKNPKTIQELFDTIAPQYDRANSIISFRLHKRWNQTFWNRVVQGDHPSPLLDICCGTGETTLPYLRTISERVEVTLLAFSVQMLSVAQKKVETWDLRAHAVHYLTANAEEIPLLPESKQFALLAYGIRNVAQPENCLKEVFRILKPGGRFGILELTRPKNRFLRWGHALYLRTILPLLGRLVTKNQQAYEYLSGSIETFVEPDTLAQQIQEAGFSSVEMIPLSGGLATIWIAQK